MQITGISYTNYTSFSGYKKPWQGRFRTSSEARAHSIIIDNQKHPKKVSSIVKERRSSLKKLGISKYNADKISKQHKTYNDTLNLLTPNNKRRVILKDKNGRKITLQRPLTEEELNAYMNTLWDANELMQNPQEIKAIIELGNDGLSAENAVFIAKNKLKLSQYKSLTQEDIFEPEEGCLIPLPRNLTPNEAEHILTAQDTEFDFRQLPDFIYLKDIYGLGIEEAFYTATTPEKIELFCKIKNFGLNKSEAAIMAQNTDRARYFIKLATSKSAFLPRKLTINEAQIAASENFSTPEICMQLIKNGKIVSRNWCGN